MARSQLATVVLCCVCISACANEASVGPSQGVSTLFGVQLDERDRQRASAARMRALQYGEPGVPVSWRSVESGHYGTVVPGPSYQSNGTVCREYSHTIYIDGRSQSARGAACRNPDGSWTPTS